MLSDMLTPCLAATSLLLPAILSSVYAPTILHGIPVRVQRICPVHVRLRISGQHVCVSCAAFAGR